MWTIFKVFTEFVTILFLFYILFFGQEACEILVPWPGIEPALPALDGEALATGPPGKYDIPSLGSLFIFSSSKPVTSMTLYDPWFPVPGCHYRTSWRLGLEWRLVMKKCVWLKGGFAGGLGTQWGRGGFSRDRVFTSPVDSSGTGDGRSVSALCHCHTFCNSLWAVCGQVFVVFSP